MFVNSITFERMRERKIGQLKFKNEKIPLNSLIQSSAGRLFSFVSFRSPAFCYVQS